jgi:hypothetical protein
MGVAIEGTENWWPHHKAKAVLPEFDLYNRQTYYIEVFNRGKKPFEYSLRVEKPWIQILPMKGKIETEERLWVGIDWEKVPTGQHDVPITIIGPENTQVVVHAIINNPAAPKREKVNGFIESNKYISMEAFSFSIAIGEAYVNWLEIPNLGRTGSAMTPIPVTEHVPSPGGNSPRLEYPIYFLSTGEVNVKTYVSPILNFTNKGLRYAISFDDEQPQIVNIHEKETAPDWLYPQTWNQMVSDNIKILTSRQFIQKPGEHILKFWMVDPGIVLQKIVVETGIVRPSYLGPPESFRGEGRSKKEK